MIRIATIVGARPQFVKAAVISRIVRSERYRHEISEYLVHTGQHYDANMSEVFFREMMIPQPDRNLEIGSGTHGAMTGQMLVGIEEVISAEKPDLVVVYGDTDSTLSGALAASKLNIPIVHVEAGLRSYNKRMPEEQNRILTDHLSAYLYCPTETAVQNLHREGIYGACESAPPTSDMPLLANVGDVMLDATLFYQRIAVERPDSSRALTRTGVTTPFRLLTLHRAENTDDRDRLKTIFDRLNAADDMTIVFPAHPRTQKCIRRYGIDLASHIRVIEPVGYLDMLELEMSSEIIITDSGGVQKEAYFCKKPCVTLRGETEWVETVESGWNTLAGNCAKVTKEFLRSRMAPKNSTELFGDGHAGERIIGMILSAVGKVHE